MQWYPEVSGANPNAIKSFVGNKIDLRSSGEEVQNALKNAFIGK
jgi:hypothetical protein